MCIPNDKETFATPKRKQAFKKVIISGICGLLCITGAITVSCRKSSAVNDRAKQTAVAALKYSFGNSGSLRVISVTDADSIVDVRFFSQEDSHEIMAVMEYLSSRSLASYQNVSLDNQTDNNIYELSESTSRAGLALQAMMNQISTPDSDTPGKLSGWKVKVVYNKSGNTGITSRWQRWFAIDPTGNSVLESYDFPYVAESH